MADMMSNAELDAKIEEADRKKRKQLSKEELEEYKKKGIEILKKNGHNIDWIIIDGDKDSELRVRGSFIHPDGVELSADALLPIGDDIRFIFNELTSDIAEGFEIDRKRKIKMTIDEIRKL